MISIVSAQNSLVQTHCNGYIEFVLSRKILYTSPACYAWMHILNAVATEVSFLLYNVDDINIHITKWDEIIHPFSNVDHDLAQSP